MRRSTTPMRRARSIPMRAMRGVCGAAPWHVNAASDRVAPHAATLGGRTMSVPVTRRAFLAGSAVVASTTLIAPRARAQAKATITYWNGLTGADGKVMDELIDKFTAETGIRIEQQRLPWAELYAKLQVAVPAGEGPDLALIHTVEVPHFAYDGVLEAIDDATLAAKGFRGEDYLPATWQGGTFQG